MIIAQQKKQENIVEYILYMWQIEDLIRAHNFDLDLIEKNIISQFDVDNDTKKAMKVWYDNIIATMQNEGVTEKGHIQVLQAVVDDLNDLHLQLLNSPFHQDYQKAYQDAAPYLTEFFMKSDKDPNKSIIELALEFMYGIWMLRLQKKTISKDTQEAVDKISKMLALLAKKYHDREKQEDFLI